MNKAIRTMSNEAIGRLVRRRREQQEMRQTELAEASGYSVRMIGLIEGGQRTKQVSLDAVKTVLEALHLNPEMLAPPKLEHIRENLPIAGHVHGRDEELISLWRDWFDPGVSIRVIQGMGGLGKSTIVSRWMQDIAAFDEGLGPTSVFAYSFASGQPERKPVAVDPLIRTAMEFYCGPSPSDGSEMERGRRLSELVFEPDQSNLFILDGFEALLVPPSDERDTHGRIAHETIRELILRIARNQCEDCVPRLCVITTRWPLIDHQIDSTRVANELLSPLSPEAGTELLRDVGVKGDSEDLRSAVEEYEGHPLALSLLGSYLKKNFDGAIEQRHIIGPVEATDKDNQARRVMEAYDKSLSEKHRQALRVLSLLAPSEELQIEPEILSELCRSLLRKPAITALNDQLVSLRFRQWRDLLVEMEEYGLIRIMDRKDRNSPTHVHPLVRQHFLLQLSNAANGAARAGNERIFEVYTDEAPASAARDKHVFQFVATIIHGCNAGRFADGLALYRKYVEKAAARLGMIETAKMALVCFYRSRDYDEDPEDCLPPSDRAYVFAQAGLAFWYQGSLKLAATLLKRGYRLADKHGDEYAAACYAHYLSRVSLSLAKIDDALNFNQCSIEHADKADAKDVAKLRIETRARRGYTLQQDGRTEEARHWFIEAESLQSELDEKHDLLHGLSGYLYCDFMMDLGTAELVVERATRTLCWARDSNEPLDIGLDLLSLGRAHIELGDLDDARVVLSEAIDFLVKRGIQHYVIRAKLASGNLYALIDDYATAKRELGEALDMAQRCGKPRHQIDAHINLCHLYRASGESESMRREFTSIRRLHADHPYPRREHDIDLLGKEIESTTPDSSAVDAK